MGLDKAMTGCAVRTRMSGYRPAPIPGAPYFFTLNAYRRQALLTHGEVLTALRPAHRVVRATQPPRRRHGGPSR